MATFTDSRFMPAAQKRRVLAQWRRFLQMLARNYADKPRCFRAFPDALYSHMIQHCSFIAHYHRLGFFSHYFDHGDDTIQFLRQFDRQANPGGRSTVYGDPLWLSGEYADINEAMRDAAFDVRLLSPTDHECDPNHITGQAVPERVPGSPWHLVRPPQRRTVPRRHVHRRSDRPRQRLPDGRRPPHALRT